MRSLILPLIVGALLAAPFVLLRRPWAVGLWRRVRLILVIYMVVIVVSAIIGLVLRWDAIYG